LELAPCFAHEPVPDAIVAPLGTGGTTAGLVLAMELLGWRTRVVGVRVAPRLVANGWRVRKLARGAARLLRAAGIDVPKRIRELLIFEGMGRGYGYPTREGEAAGALAGAAGLHLDPTYGAKAFAMIPALSGRGLQRLVFWHTFSAPTIQTS